VSSQRLRCQREPNGQELRGDERFKIRHQMGIVDFDAEEEA
jgi:hypothetical protein